MRVNLLIVFKGGRERLFRKVEFPRCKTMDKVRTWMTVRDELMNINGTLVNKSNIETIDIYDYDAATLEEYREKNPEYKKEN